jgi:hypothetical protein
MWQINSWEVLKVGIPIVISILAIIFSLRASSQNGKLQTQLNEKNSALQTLLNEKNTALQRELNSINTAFQTQMEQEKTRIDKRRFITVLWDRMFQLNEVNPKEPIEPDIRQAYNTLEAVAMSWEADLVDENLVVASFGKLYERLFEQIKAVPKIPGRNISGASLLNDNRRIESVYLKIRERLAARDKI